MIPTISLFEQHIRKLWHRSLLPPPNGRTFCGTQTRSSLSGTSEMCSFWCFGLRWSYHTVC